MEVSAPLKRAGEGLFIGITHARVALVELEVSAGVFGWHRAPDEIPRPHTNASSDGVVVNLTRTAS
jgi:hypothetical protein